MDQPFYIISGHVWVIVVLMLMAGLGAVALCRSAFAARKVSVRWLRGLWLAGGVVVSALLLWGSQWLPLALHAAPVFGAIYWPDLAAALVLCLAATLFSQWLLMRRE